MLRALIAFATRKPWFVAALTLAMAGYAARVASKAKLDVFPDFGPPQVEIQTEAPGLTPEQVEILVTRPVENAVAGAGGIASVRSETILGLSVVTVVFAEGQDIYRAQQLIAQRLAAVASQLPATAKAPKLSPLTSATMDLLKIGIVSDRLGPRELRSFADWTLRPRLLAAKGVARATVFGGEVRQYQVLVRPERLEAFDLSVADVTAAARAATAVRGAGYVETANQRILVESEGQALTVERLAEAAVARPGGGAVRLGDVASVVEGPALAAGDALIQARPGVLVTMATQLGENTLDATHAVEAALDELRPAMTAMGITLYDRLHRPASFIEVALANMMRSLRAGALLVVAVLILFLFNLRAALISLTAIPLSLLAALMALDQTGATINTMSLGGLVIALGEVVDDAIIDVENIHRRLRLNQSSASPLPAADVILAASLEVRGSVVYATVVVILVFLPVIAMGGLAGKFFAPLGIAYCLAVLASLAVALVATPALATLAIGGHPGSDREPWLQRSLKQAYAAALRPLLRWPWFSLIAAMAAVAAAAALIPTFGGEFLPPFREGHFVVQLAAAPGTSLPEMRRQCERISAAILKDSRVSTVETQIGRAELGEDTWPPNRAEMHVELRRDPHLDEEAFEGDLRALVSGFPGLAVEVLTFLGDRISETLTGETAQVAVSVFGPDLDVLDAKAAEIQRILQATPGAADVRLPAPPGAPRMQVRLRPERLREFGYTAAEVLEVIETAFAGQVAAQVYKSDQAIDVAVILDPRDRLDPAQIGRLRTPAAAGARMPLATLADIDLVEGRDIIRHERARRRQTVTCNAEGRDLESFVADARRRVEGGVSLPNGYYFSWGGPADQATAARRDLWSRGALAGAGVVLCLFLAVRRGRLVCLVLANLPFALVGGVAAVALSGGVLSLGSLVGFVTLFGISARNSIMLVSHLDHLVRVEGLPWDKAAVVRGASERLGPILMTALVTGLGLLPLALDSGKAGREIEGPMALVILGGLVSSTALNLLVLPPLAWRFGRFGAIRPQAPKTR